MYIKSLTSTRLQIKTKIKTKNYTKTYTNIIIMATTLIDTRKSIMGQIHESWDQFRSTDEAMVLMFGEVGSNYNDYHNIPLGKDFAKNDAPWTSKQSVLEKNTAHANKLIRLYIALNIDVAYRMPIWKFFEIQSGVVSRIKDETKLLKRIQKAMKLEQQLGLDTSDATKLFITQYVSIDELEADLKVKVKAVDKAAAKAAKAAKKLAATHAKVAAKAKKLALKAGVQAAKKGAKKIARIEKAEAKKIAKAEAKALRGHKKLVAAQAKENRKFVLAVAKQIEKNSIAAEKLGNKLAKKTIALLKWAEAHEFELEHIVDILESEIESARRDNTMKTIIDIA
jgi:antitoxin component of RelBE/YafQ-DinJ toxin-antitoxin module